MLRGPLDLGVRAVSLLTGTDHMGGLRRILGWLCRTIHPSIDSFRRPALGLVSPPAGTDIQVFDDVPGAGQHVARWAPGSRARASPRAGAARARRAAGATRGRSGLLLVPFA